MVEVGDLGPWHGGPEPDLLLAYEALLVGSMPANTGSCSMYWCLVVSIQGLYERLQLRLTSIVGWCACFCSMLGQQCSAGACTSARAEVRSVDELASPSCTHKFADECTACHDLISWVLQDVVGRRVSCQA